MLYRKSWQSSPQRKAEHNCCGYLRRWKKGEKSWREHNLDYSSGSAVQPGGGLTYMTIATA